MLVRACAVLVFCSATAALAQTTRPASTQPARQSAEEMLTQLLRPTTQAAKPLQPIADGGGGVVNRMTGSGALPPGAPQLNLLNEGTVIVDRVGRIARIADGQNWELTLESDGRVMKDPPMLVLPNKMLTAMQQAVISQSADIKFRISGEVTEYNNRNYILIQKAAQIAEITQPK
jgi:hypothetical protein